MKDWRALAGFVALSEGAGIIGSVFTASSVQGWYATLTKPELAPPNGVFGPVWTTLFLLMGIAAFLVWRTGFERWNVRVALGIFGLQLALNILWSIIFFGLHSPGVAFAEIIVLWLAIVATVWAFAKISPPSSSIWTTDGHGKLAAWLLIPYIAWVSFAGYLNFLLWTLNQ